MRRKRKALRAVRPNLGIEAAYREKLHKLIAEMSDSVLYWVRSAYRQNEPEVAQDALPATELQKAVRKLSRRWQKKFDTLSGDLASHFTRSVSRRSDACLTKVLRDNGWTVDFKLTAAQKDILRATVHENVSLIRNLPRKHFLSVEGAVMRSVQTGRDLSSLTRDLQKELGITRRRATAIARDQNNKATSALQHARYRELGIRKAIWLHSGGGKTVRRTHVKNNGKEYDVKKGWYDPDVKQHIQTGQLINCHCVSRPVLPY